MDRLQLTGSVPADVGKRIQLGAPAVIKVDAFPDATFSGQISHVGPNAESEND